MCEGQSCECSKEELETWEKHAKKYTWADEHDQLLTCVWNLPGCCLVFFHCPSHHLPTFWALSALGDGAGGPLEADLSICNSWAWGLHMGNLC